MPNFSPEEAHYATWIKQEAKELCEKTQSATDGLKWISTLFVNSKWTHEIETKDKITFLLIEIIRDNSQSFIQFRAFILACLEMIQTEAENGISSHLSKQYRAFAINAYEKLNALTQKAKTLAVDNKDRKYQVFVTSNASNRVEISVPERNVFCLFKATTFMQCYNSGLLGINAHQYLSKNQLTALEKIIEKDAYIRELKN